MRVQRDEPEEHSSQKASFEMRLGGTDRQVTACLNGGRVAK